MSPNKPWQLIGVSNPWRPRDASATEASQASACVRALGISVARYRPPGHSRYLAQLRDLYPWTPRPPRLSDEEAWLLHHHLSPVDPSWFTRLSLACWVFEPNGRRLVEPVFVRSAAEAERLLADIGRNQDSRLRPMFFFDEQQVDPAEVVRLATAIDTLTVMRAVDGVA